MATRGLYLSDLLTGLFAGLAVRGIPVVSLRGGRFDAALERLVGDVEQEAEKAGLALRFRIRTHPIHRDSAEVQQALYEAAQRDLVSLDNPEFQDIRLKISQAEAPSYFEGLPGTQEMYVRLANRLVEYYREA